MLATLKHDMYLCVRIFCNLESNFNMNNNNIQCFKVIQIYFPEPCLAFHRGKLPLNYFYMATFCPLYLKKVSKMMAPSYLLTKELFIGDG